MNLILQLLWVAFVLSIDNSYSLESKVTDEVLHRTLLQMPVIDA